MKSIYKFEEISAIKDIYRDIKEGLERHCCEKKLIDGYIRIIVIIESLAFCTYLVNDTENRVEVFKDLLYSPMLPAFRFLDNDEKIILKNVQRLFGSLKVMGNVDYLVSRYKEIQDSVKWLTFNNNVFSFKDSLRSRGAKYKLALFNLFEYQENKYEEVERDEENIVNNVNWQDYDTSGRHSVKLGVNVASLAGNEIKMVNKKKEKLTITINELQQCCREMDEVEKTIGFSKRQRRNWENFINELEFQRTTDKALEMSNDIEIDGISHWVGKTSVGKSTLMRILAYFMAKFRNRITTLIVKDIVEVAETINLLNKLNVKAVPYISYNQRKSHLEQYVNSLDEKQSNFLLYEDEFFKYIDEVCPLYYLENNENISYKKPPCFNIQDEEKFKVCPFLKNCDYLRMYRELPEAQVVVTTLQSAVYGDLHKGIFKDKVPVIEYLCKISDLILVDEADKCQGISDEIFIPYMDLMKPGIFHRINYKLSRLLVNNPDKLMRHKIFNDWHEEFSKVTVSIEKIYEILFNNRDIAKRCSRSPFSHRTSLDWACKKLTKNIKDEDKKKSIIDEFKKKFNLIKGNLMLYISDRNGLLLSIDKMLMDFLEDNCLKINIKEIEKIKNYITLSVLGKIFEDNFQNVCNNFYIIQDIIYRSNFGNKDELLNDIRLLTDIAGKYSGVLPMAPIVYEVGIQYSVENEGLKVHIYSANGRYLLNNLHNVFELNDAQKTNCILLSGTSFMPYSSKYDLDIKPTYLIKRKVNENIEIKYEMYYPRDKKGNVIHISGVEEDFKEEKLRESVNCLLRDKIDDKDLFDRILEDSPEGRKRIVLIVNSYEQCEIVFDALKEKPGFTGKVFKLVNKASGSIQDGEWPRQKLNKFGRGPGIILIVPIMSMERGHNILNKDNVAAIYTAVYLVRPFPVPYELNDYASLLNGGAMCLYNEDSDSRDFYEQVKKIQKSSFAKKDRYFNSTTAYRFMDDDFRDILITNTYVTMHQVESRLIRGDVGARVIFAEGSFHPILDNGEENTSETSILIGMRDIFKYILMKDNVQAEILRELYGVRIDGLKNLKILY